MKRRESFYLSVVLLLTMIASTVACNKAPNDNQIASDVQNKLTADSGLAGKQLVVQSEAGTVTLSGTVDNDTQRDAAAKYAASVSGVKQVVNNLQVTPPTPVPAAEPTPPPVPVEQPKVAKRHTPRKSSSQDQNSDTGASQMAQNQAPPEPAPAPAAAPAVVPATPPPPPPPQKVTIPAGTALAVRLEDALNSETNTLGQTFRATLTSAITANGDVAIPSGSEVTGHIVDVKSAGRFAGASDLILQLDSISSGGSTYNISTDQYKRTGSSRGKNTA